MKFRSSWFGGLSAIIFALGGVATVAAYSGQVAASVEITVGSIKCNEPITVTATVLDQNGNAISGQLVVWALTSSPSTADTISPTSSITNANGVATTTVKLACIPGNRHLRATADEVSGTAVFGLTEGQVKGVTGLPNTTTAPPNGAPEAGTTPVLLAILVVLVAGGLTLRRLLPVRR
jgi:hypothetical protein